MQQAQEANRGGTSYMDNGD